MSVIVENISLVGKLYHGILLQFVKKIDACSYYKDAYDLAPDKTLLIVSNSSHSLRMIYTEKLCLDEGNAAGIVIELLCYDLDNMKFYLLVDTYVEGWGTCNLENPLNEYGGKIYQFFGLLNKLYPGV